MTDHKHSTIYLHERTDLDLPVVVELDHADAAKFLRDVLVEELPSLEAVKRWWVLTVIYRCGGNLSQAGRTLGVDRRSLHRWLDEWRNAGALLVDRHQLRDRAANAAREHGREGPTVRKTAARESIGADAPRPVAQAEGAGAARAPVVGDTVLYHTGGAAPRPAVVLLVHPGGHEVDLEVFGVRGGVVSEVPPHGGGAHPVMHGWSVRT